MVHDAASNARKTIRAAGGSGILYGLLIGAVFSIGTDSAILGVITAAPYVITGGLLALTCQRWLGYVLFVLQGLALLVVGGIRLKVGLAVWTFATLGLLNQARELRSGEPPTGANQ